MSSALLPANPLSGPAGEVRLCRTVVRIHRLLPAPDGGLGRQPCVVGCTISSLPSTFAGWSMAKAMASATAEAGIASYSVAARAALSARVIGAIGHVLRLVPGAREHLFRPPGLDPRLGPDRPGDLVHPWLLRLLEAFPQAAGYVFGPVFDVLAANAIADVLLAPFGTERNMPRILFTHLH